VAEGERQGRQEFESQCDSGAAEAQILMCVREDWRSKGKEDMATKVLPLSSYRDGEASLSIASVPSNSDRRRDERAYPTACCGSMTDPSDSEERVQTGRRSVCFFKTQKTEISEALLALI